MPISLPDLVRLTLLSVALMGVWGCEQALFPEEMPRTQFERYDRMHGRYVPAEIASPTGRNKTALRERLTPNQP